MQNKKHQQTRIGRLESKISQTNLKSVLENISEIVFISENWFRTGSSTEFRIRLPKRVLFSYIIVSDER